MNDHFCMQTHRYRDSLAIYIGTGETVYLPANDARNLSRAINKTVRSIERESFQDSPNNLDFNLEGEQGQ